MYFVDTSIDSSKSTQVIDGEVNNVINKLEINEEKGIKNEEDEVLVEETYSVLCGDSTTVVMPKKKEETQEDIEARLRPVDRFIIPSMVYDFTPDEKMVYIVGTQGRKVTKIAGLDHMIVLEELVLRSCLVSSMEGVENLTTLTKLELYDNVIEEICCVDRLSNLTILDLSFNAIREIISLSSCPLLKELYIAQNKLRKIKGLDALIHLKTLDLGANRIRVIEGLVNCTSLESLW
jgi:protein phosphatase 1 regulatory subunit 7